MDLTLFRIGLLGQNFITVPIGGVLGYHCKDYSGMDLLAEVFEHVQAFGTPARPL